MTHATAPPTSATASGRTAARDALLRDLATLNARATDLDVRVQAHLARPLDARVLAWEATADQLQAERREWQRDAAVLAARLADFEVGAGDMMGTETQYSVFIGR